MNRYNRGFSIVEILVAMVIALLGMIIIFQVFSLSEGIKRTSTSGGDAQQNGLLALFSMERHARMAGFGINYAPLLGCTVVAYNSGPPARDFTFTLVGVQIADGASGAPDGVTFAFGNSDLVLVPAKLTGISAVASTAFRIDNRYGFRLSDLAIVAEVGSTKNCSLRQITSLPPAADEIDHVTGSYVDVNGATVSSTFNKGAGLGIAYNAWDNTAQTGGRLYNVGPSPSVIAYSIANSQLVMQDQINGTSISIADGIVQLQAQFGKDTDGDGNVDLWQATMPATPTTTDWSRVLAIRIAVAARSALAERPDRTTGICNTTTVQPTWSGGTLTVSGDPNWMCYRYKVFETTVPLRNQIWLQPS